MGTSVRKASTKIKQLLEGALVDSPQSGIDDVIPEVAKETIRASRTKGYFGDKDFSVLAGGGLLYFRKIASIGYDGFIREYKYDPQKVTVIEMQAIIEAILDDIEQRDGDIQSSFILNAFKMTMTNALMGKITDPIVFLTHFCEVFLDMIIRENASEELSRAFIGVAPYELDDAISSYAKSYVADNFYDHIVKCVLSEMDIAELVTILQEELNS